MHILVYRRDRRIVTATLSLRCRELRDTYPAGSALLLRVADMTSYLSKGSSPSTKSKKRVDCPAQPFSANEFHHEPHPRLLLVAREGRMGVDKRP